jgi:hypothetical protein
MLREFSRRENMKVKPDIIGITKMWAGATLFVLSGGVALLILGLLPAGALIAILGLLSAGVVSAADVGILAAIGTIYVLVGVPIALYGAGLFDAGLKAVFSMSLGINRIAKSGAEKVPIVGKAIGATL